MSKPKTATYHVQMLVTNPETQEGQHLAGDLAVTTGTVPAPAPLTLGPETLPDGQAGQAYTATLEAAGGVKLYTYQLADGVLPAGLALDAATGRISGTPTAAAAAAVTAEVVDAMGVTADHDYTITIAAAPAPTVEVLRCVEYLGAMRMPNDAAATFTFAYGGLAARRRSDGTLTFFLALQETSFPGQLVEISDTRSYSKDWHTAPQASVVSWTGDICQGKKGTWISSVDRARTMRALEARLRTLPLDQRTVLLGWLERLRAKTPKAGELEWYEFYPGQAPIGGLFWDKEKHAIYWTYGDGYNVSGRPDWGMGATELRDDGSVIAAHGPWRLTGTDKDGVTRKGPWMAGFFGEHPNGDLITGSTLQSGNTGSSWGAEAYTGATRPALEADPMVDLPMPIRLMRHYPMAGLIDQTGLANGPITSQRRAVHPPLWEDPMGGPVLNVNPAHYHGVASWQQVDVITGIQWIEYQGKRALMFTGLNAGSKIQDPTNPKAAHVWYSNVGVGALNCPSHGIPPPVSITGPVSTATMPVSMSYAIPDVERIVRGELEDYAAEPAEYLDLGDQFGVRIGPPEVMAAGFNGGFFDDTRGIFFTVSQRADDVTVWGTWTSLVHAFRLG